MDIWHNVSSHSSCDFKHVFIVKKYLCSQLHKFLLFKVDECRRHTTTLPFYVHQIFSHSCSLLVHYFHITTLHKPTAQVIIFYYYTSVQLLSLSTSYVNDPWSLMELHVLTATSFRALCATRPPSSSSLMLLLSFVKSRILPFLILNLIIKIEMHASLFSIVKILLQQCWQLFSFPWVLMRSFSGASTSPW